MTTLEWNHYKYFPYEKDLARREVQSLLGSDAVTGEDEQLEIPEGFDARRVQRLTYFGVARAPGDKILVPLQAQLEQSQRKNGTSSTAPQRRQATRYSAHGLHEYKGKFNPQVVRAIGNILGAEPGMLVLDPFCGSGTTLLESAHCGWNAVGTDLHPLAVLISNAKVAAFRSSQRTLRGALEDIEAALERSRAKAKPNGLPNLDYLKRWFHESTLAEVAVTLKTIRECAPKKLHSVFHIILSDVLREASLQEPADLRIRKRKDPDHHYPVIAPFLESADRKLEVIRNAREVVGKVTTKQAAYHLDVRSATRTDLPVMATLGRRTADLAITSPPYVTALPYIDIHRLSLCILGMIGHREIMPSEKALIGNREISRRDRESIEAAIEENSHSLTDSVIGLCRSMLADVRSGSDGFRRQNVPALTHKYFSEMSSALGAVRRLVKKGGHFALLVGPNQTKLGGREYRIPTAELLAELAEARGWEVVEIVPFETYQRFDLHQINSIREEQLVVLRN